MLLSPQPYDVAGVSLGGVEVAAGSVVGVGMGVGCELDSGVVVAGSDGLVVSGVVVAVIG